MSDQPPPPPGEQPPPPPPPPAGGGHEPPPPPPGGGYQPPPPPPGGGYQPPPPPPPPGGGYQPPPPPPGGGYVPPPPPGGGYQPAGGYAVAAPNDSQSMLSLILGILGLVCCPILGPVAFFLGNSSLNRIRASNGALGGAGLSQAGRILGIIGTIWLVLAIVYFILAFASAASHAGR